MMLTSTTVHASLNFIIIWIHDHRCNNYNVCWSIHSYHHHVPKQIHGMCKLLCIYLAFQYKHCVNNKIKMSVFCHSSLNNSKCLLKISSRQVFSLTIHILHNLVFRIVYFRVAVQSVPLAASHHHHLFHVEECWAVAAPVVRWSH